MNPLADVLEQEFKKKKKAQTRYTRKMFAREIGIAASTLSGVLRGHHGLSPKRANKILEQLKLPQETVKELQVFIASEYSRSHSARKEAKKALSQETDWRDYHIIPEEDFPQIMNWHHTAIIELSKTRPFKAESSFVAERLGISKYEASLAIKRLKKLGLISKKFGKFEPASDRFEVIARTSSEAMKNYHEQMLDKAKANVRDSDFNDHELSSLMCPINPEDLPRAKKFIRKFWQEFDKEFERSDAKELYALNVQLFPLSKKVKESDV